MLLDLIFFFFFLLSEKGFLFFVTVEDWYLWSRVLP